MILSDLKVQHFLALVCLLANFSTSGQTASPASSSFGQSVCRVLKNKFVSSNPWLTYPIIYEPLNHGRLVVWTAISTLPSSEFKCYQEQEELSLRNSSSDYLANIVMDFGNSVNKLEWTFYEANRGANYNGVSVNHFDQSRFSILIEDAQSKSYLNCNLIKQIKRIPADQQQPIDLRSFCQECPPSLIKIIDSQLRELIKTKLSQQLVENLYWHLSQLITSQQFQRPTSVV